MDDKQFLTLQKLVIDYFEKETNENFIGIVDSFVYNRPAKNEKVSKLLEKFLKDNGLEIAFVNYVSDFVMNENTYLRRSRGSDIAMIEGLKTSFLNASFNRFRQHDDDIKISKRIKSEHKYMKESVSKLMDAGSTDRYHEALDELRDLAISWDK